MLKIDIDFHSSLIDYSLTSSVISALDYSCQIVYTSIIVFLNKANSMILKYFSILFLLFITAPGLRAQCNGAAQLCTKRYDQVAYLTTHNAFNSDEGGFSLPNQTYDMETQLNDGVRAFMIDVYNWFGNTVVYHGTGVLGTSPLEDELQKIESFLAANPNEIVTLILECNVSANEIENAINNTGLNSYLHTHQSGLTWPTLQDMITSNERLVVMTDVDDASPSQGWYHYMWDIAVETHYSANSMADFNCDFNRGDSLNDLFIFNHFITNSVLGTGMASEAEVINANPYFIERVQMCQSEKSKFPNFITVDFYELGDSKLVVDQINGVAPLSIYGLPSLSDEVAICPNPVSDQLVIQSDVASFDNYKVFSSTGKNVTSRTQLHKSANSEWTLTISSLESGVYIIRTQKTANRIIVQ